VRAARVADEKRLRELTFESKAHWGYDHDLVRSWSEGLEFQAGCERWAAEEDGRIVAWASLTPPHEEVAILDHLWVHPTAFGRGIGTRLFRIVVDRARQLGAARLEWGAEPNAVGFYEKMGGRYLRDHVSEWGRVTPWMGLEL